MQYLKLQPQMELGTADLGSSFMPEQISQRYTVVTHRSMKIDMDFNRFTYLKRIQSTAKSHYVLVLQLCFKEIFDYISIT